MNKRIIANCIIEAFQEYPVKEQLLMMQNSKTVEEKIVTKFGQEKFNELIRATLGDWREAWLLFEKHHGIFKNEDIKSIMSQ